MARLAFKEENVGNIQIKYAVSRRQPCLIAVLYVNGFQASIFDFGVTKDLEEPPARFFGCMNRQFIPHRYPPSDIYTKYNITKEELADINAFFKRILNFGHCSFCDDYSKALAKEANLR